MEGGIRLRLPNVSSHRQGADSPRSRPRPGPANVTILEPTQATQGRGCAMTLASARLAAVAMCVCVRNRRPWVADPSSCVLLRSPLLHLPPSGTRSRAGRSRGQVGIAKLGGGRREVRLQWSGDGFARGDTCHGVTLACFLGDDSFQTSARPAEARRASPQEILLRESVSRGWNSMCFDGHGLGLNVLCPLGGNRGQVDGPTAWKGSPISSGRCPG